VHTPSRSDRRARGHAVSIANCLFEPRSAWRSGGHRRVPYVGVGRGPGAWLRTVDVRVVGIETSLGRIDGELLSDGIAELCLHKSPTSEIEIEGRVEGADDLAELIARLGVPIAEAQEQAKLFWSSEIAPLRATWQESERLRDARERQRAQFFRRLARLCSRGR
jgi:hypothetical protein